MCGGGRWYATSRSRVTAKVCGDGNQLKKKVVGANGQLFFLRWTAELEGGFFFRVGTRRGDSMYLASFFFFFCYGSSFFFFLLCAVFSPAALAVSENGNEIGISYSPLRTTSRLWMFVNFF